MKVSYLDSLEPGYRFTDEDQDRCWEILGKYFAPMSDYEMTPEESEFEHIIHIAEELKHRNKFWPTKEAVIAEIERRAEEKRQHDALIRSYARPAEKQQ